MDGLDLVTDALDFVIDSLDSAYDTFHIGVDPLNRVINTLHPAVDIFKTSTFLLTLRTSPSTSFTPVVQTSVHCHRCLCFPLTSSDTSLNIILVNNGKQLGINSLISPRFNSFVAIPKMLRTSITISTAIPIMTVVGGVVPWYRSQADGRSIQYD